MSPAYAQTLDTDPPRVGLDSVDEARKGDSQVFTVTATDDQEIESIVFFYRLDADGDFQRGNMSRIGGTDLYTFTIHADELGESVNLIQYYVEAKDKAGNRTLQGFFFDPIQRLLVDQPQPMADAGTPDQAPSKSFLGSLSTTQKLLYGALGVVIVGAVVSAASSSGGDSGPTVPATILIEPL